MSTAIRLTNAAGYDNVETGCEAGGPKGPSRAWLVEARWSTKQLISVCLWSSLIGIGFGYVWQLLQLVVVGCE
jgi:hypothetical protein